MAPTAQTLRNGPWRAPLAGALLLLTAVFALLGPALPYDLLVIDRAFAVGERAPAEVELLFGPGDGAAPALRVSRRQDAAFWGATAFGQRLHALMLHAANSILLFLLLWAPGRRLGPALAAALLFAILPTSAVAALWLGGRAALLATGFSLCALAAHAWYRKRPGLLPAAAALLAFALALLTHPGAAALPLLALGHRLLHRGRAAGPRDLAPAFALAAAALVFHARTGSAPAPPSSPWAWCALAYPATAALVAAGALDAPALGARPRRALAAAVPLLLLAATAGTLAVVRVWRSDGEFLRAALRLQPRYEPARVWLALDSRARGRPVDAQAIAAGLGPHREAWAGAFTAAADRRAAAGDALGAARLLDHAAVLAPALGPVRRRAGDVARQLGREDAAFSNYVAALKADPRDAEALYGLGAVLLARGQRGDALDLFRQAVAEKPDHTNAVQACEEMDAAPP